MPSVCCPRRPRPRWPAVIAVVNTWQAHFAQAGVTVHDMASLAERLDGEALLSQRTGFDPSRFQALPAKRKRPGPFQRG